jgi:hypothetical protein
MLGMKICPVYESAKTKCGIDIQSTSILPGGLPAKASQLRRNVVFGIFATCIEDTRNHEKDTLMSNRLYFTYDETQGDAVPFIWNEDLNGTPKDAYLVLNEDQYEINVTDIMNASNRSRTLLLVDNKAAADVLALQLMADENASCVITDLGNDRYCVGATLFSGAYDDGLPLLTILTDGTTDFDLDASVLELLTVFDASEDEHKSVITISSETPDMDLS